MFFFFCRLSAILQEQMDPAGEGVCGACFGLVSFVDECEQKVRSAEADLRLRFQRGRQPTDAAPQEPSDAQQQHSAHAPTQVRAAPTQASGTDAQQQHCAHAPTQVRAVPTPGQRKHGLRVWLSAGRTAALIFGRVVISELSRRRSQP